MRPTTRRVYVPPIPRLAPLLAMVSATSLAGPLDPPPGPVAPTMKTLDQVEPRIPINSLPFTISVSGSYYLTRSLVGQPGESGVTVRARRVTIDLSGFELRGAAGTLDAIEVVRAGVSSCADITVRNGAIRGWGRDGVNASCASGAVFENLRVEGNTGAGLVASDFAIARECIIRECGNTGIELGSGSRVEGCIVALNGQDGIGVEESSLVLDTSSLGNGRIGVRAGERSVVQNVAASGNGAVGVRVETQSTVTRVTAHNNRNTGIALNGRGVIVECTATDNTPNGILAFPGSRIERCVVSNNTSVGIVLNGPGVLVGNSLVDNPTGIRVNNEGSRVDGNDITGGDTGVRAPGAGNLVVRNTVRDAKTPFDLATGNQTGPISSTMTDHPWANFVEK